MSPPDHFVVAYEINPFMHVAVAVDHERAAAQWDGLRAVLVGLGAEVRLQPAAPGLPDLVFTANAGLVLEGRGVPPGSATPSAAGEEAPSTGPGSRPRAWRCGSSRGRTPSRAPATPCPPGRRRGARGVPVAHGSGAHVELAAALGRPVRSVALTDERFYHLDLALLPWAPAGAGRGRRLRRHAAGSWAPPCPRWRSSPRGGPRLRGQRASWSAAPWWCTGARPASAVCWRRGASTRWSRRWTST